MVKVSQGSARKFAESFEGHTAHSLDFSDAELAIVRVRGTLGSKLISNDQQGQVAARVLTVIKAWMLEHAPALRTAWTADEWSRALWAMLEPATSHTLAVQSCPEVFGTSELQKNAVAMTLAETPEKDTEVVNSVWSHRWLAGMMLACLAGLLS